MNELEENLFRSRKILIKELSSLNDNEFNQRVDTNKWSIAQICHHLVITEILFTKAIISGLDKMNVTESTRKPIHLVLDKSKKFQAPEISEPRSEPFQVLQILLLLNESRKNLTEAISKVDDKTILKTITAKHPVFEDLPLDQWIELLYLHEQRHIEQIITLKSLR
ncbi:DinB family protein [Paenibacillus piscarius]|uniref:DinB family protein n=1 Tax=Paenibacillus piscarius TaxID=1089681 RepID=UPI001EE90E84|nr:DinB family protein [Paenibacillus piscarius]